MNADTLWWRLVRGVRRLRQAPDWARCAGPGWADGVMAAEVTDRLHVKQGRSTGRLVLGAGGEAGQGLAVYLKRHHRLPWWQRLLATLWRGGRSPAFREWDHLEWARRQGLPAPEPVAAGEFAGPWGRLESFLAVRELTGMLPLNEAVPLAAGSLGPGDFRLWKRGLAAELARLTRLLHDRHCFHKDLYLCHFFVHADDTRSVPGGEPAESWRGRVHLIDLHRLAHHPWTWRIWRVKDLAQLLYSSEVPGVDVRDRLCFWRHYRGLLPARAADSWLPWAVRLKWRRYRAHNLRRKARLAEGHDANRP